MKWFKHETDAHMNLKLQAVINYFGEKGAEAFGYYWACAELTGNQGDDFRLKREKQWPLHLKKFLNIEIDQQKKFLTIFARYNLIDKEALRIGDLYMPKLEERQDEYTEKLRRKSRHNPDNVPLEQIRTEENRTEQNICMDAFERFWKAYPNKEAKKKTLEIWKRKKCYEHIDGILDFIEKAKLTERWTNGYIKQPPTFLNNESWNDDVTAYGKKTSPLNALDQGSTYRKKAVESISKITIET